MAESYKNSDSNGEPIHTTMSDGDYLSLAKTIAKSATDDPKAKHDSRAGVGAVLCDRIGNVYSSANEIPSSVKHELKVTDATSPHRYHFIEHAERAALFKASAAGAILDGAIMYCTRFPCSDCARAIVAFGLDRIVVAEGFDDSGPWIESQKAARRLFKAAGVKIRYLKQPDKQAAP